MAGDLASLAAAVAASIRPPRLVTSTCRRCKTLASCAGPASCVSERVRLTERPLSHHTASGTIRRPQPMLFLSLRDALRLADGVRHSACARTTIAMRPLAVIILAATTLPVACSGCAALRRGPVPEDVAQCRDLTQQGVAAMELGRWEDAEKLLQTAVEASPVDSATRQYLAEVLWHRGATAAALKQMEAAVQLDVSDPSLIVRLGEMQLGTGATEAALTRADEAILLNPKLASAWALRGRVYWRMNQTERALADLQRALQFAPDSSDVLMDVAAIYRERGQHDRCLTTLHHLLDTYPPGQATQLAYWMEGLTLVDLGRPQQAADSLRTANQKGPANADILYYLAQAQLAAGRTDAATATAQEALAVNPTHTASRELLTQLATRAAPAAPLVR